MHMTCKSYTTSIHAWNTDISSKEYIFLLLFMYSIYWSLVFQSQTTTLVSCINNRYILTKICIFFVFYILNHTSNVKINVIYIRSVKQFYKLTPIIFMYYLSIFCFGVKMFDIYYIYIYIYIYIYKLIYHLYIFFKKNLYNWS
jgi:hypothetical protein